MEMLQTHKLLTVDIFLTCPLEIEPINFSTRIESGRGSMERERMKQIYRETELRYEEQILVSLQFLAKAPFHITQLNPCPWVV